jgi:hypothetical protein
MSAGRRNRPTVQNDVFDPADKLNGAFRVDPDRGTAQDDGFGPLAAPGGPKPVVLDRPTAQADLWRLVRSSAGAR